MSQGVEKSYHAVNLALGVVITTLLLAVGGMWAYENYGAIKKARDEWFTSAVQTRSNYSNLKIELPKAPNGQDWAQWHNDQQIQMQKNIQIMMENNQSLQRQIKSIQTTPPRFGR